MGFLADSAELAMELKRVTPEQVAAASVETLGLDSEIADFGTPEVIAAALRRAASFTCPASPRHLTRVVEESLRGLVPIDPAVESSESSVRGMLEKLVAYGDLIEAPVSDEERGISLRTLFLGQPAYVRVSAASCLLLGVPAEGLTLLEEALMERMDHEIHVRRIYLEPGEDPANILASAGLRELTVDQWLKHPRRCSADVLLSEYDARLTSAGPSGTIEGCRILDPSKSVLYYSGRWRAPTRKDAGRYVVRRPLEFGPGAWCYAELHEGEVRKLVDLPLSQRLDRACDEAWRLQAAIDHLAGRPQKVRVQQRQGAYSPLLHLSSPIPSWAQRRLDALGRALPRQRGSLISYSISEEQLQEELTFLAETMWTETDYQGGK